MEFVRIRYPRDRQVLVDNETFRPTNRTFRVERGTHSFAIDEPADPPLAEDFIELTSQQQPREFVFTPLAPAVATRGTRSKPVRATRTRKKAVATSAKKKPRRAAPTTGKKASTRKTKASPKRKRRS